MEEPILFQKNIQALKTREFPGEQGFLADSRKQSTAMDIEMAYNRSLVFYRKQENGRLYFHSRWSPEAEAEGLVKENFHPECKLVLLMGLGFGYLAKELLKAMDATQRLMVIEPDPDIFALALEKVDLSPIFLDNRVSIHLYEGETSFRACLEALLYAPDMDVNRNNLLILIPPSYREAYGSPIKKMLEITNLCVIHIQTIQNTICFFSDIWMENYIKNLEYAPSSKDVETLFGNYKNIPAYIISAGPSLDKNIAELKKVGKNGVILSGYTSLKLLLAHGITPDFVVAIDGIQLNYENSKQQKETFSIPLIYSPLVDYRLLKKHRGTKIQAVVAYDEYTRYLCQKAGKTYKPLYAAGTVAATMVDLACSMGCGPIVFVGQDLAFQGHRAYASGTNYENLCKGENQVPADQKIILTKDAQGKDIKTSPVFMEYKRGLEDYILSRKGTRHFIDATEGGAYIQGTAVNSLRQIVKEYERANEKPELCQVLDARDEKEHAAFSHLAWSDMMEVLGKMDLLVKPVRDTLEWLDALDQREEEERQQPQYKQAVKERIHECNRLIQQLNEETEFFQFAILGRLYEADKEVLKWKKEQKEEIEVERLRAAVFYKSLLACFHKIKDIMASLKH